MLEQIQPATRKLGITKKISSYTLHRTFSSVLNPNGVDVKVVQKVAALNRKNEPRYIHRGAEPLKGKWHANPRKRLKRFGVPDEI
jgi:hypothetical protein